MHPPSRPRTHSSMSTVVDCMVITSISTAAVQQVQVQGPYPSGSRIAITQHIYMCCTHTLARVTVRVPAHTTHICVVCWAIPLSWWPQALSLPVLLLMTAVLL